MVSIPLSNRLSKGFSLLVWCGLAVGLSWWLGKAIMGWDEVGFVPLLTCLAVGLSVWIVLQPEVGLYVFVVVSFLSPRLVDTGWLPWSAFWLNDLVLMCWTIHVAVRSVGRREVPKTPFDAFFIILAAHFALSAVANTLAPMHVIVWLR